MRPTLKISKIVILIVAVTYGGTVLANSETSEFASKLICVSVVNPDTGDEQRLCAYLWNGSPFAAWSFNQTIGSLYRAETSFGYDYLYGLEMTEHNVIGCKLERAIVAR